MAIKIGDRLPAGTLHEFIDEETPGCTLGPNAFQVEALKKGKRVAVFAVPGAFTPTCSAKHAPGYVELADQLEAAKVDEIWCIAVNDAFVMGAWGKSLGAKGKVRMFADGSGTYTKALGLELTSGDLLLILEGIDLTSARRRPRYKRTEDISTSVDVRRPP